MVDSLTANLPPSGAGKEDIMKTKQAYELIVGDRILYKYPHNNHITAVYITDMVGLQNVGTEGERLFEVTLNNDHFFIVSEDETIVIMED